MAASETQNLDFARRVFISKFIDIINLVFEKY